MITEGMREKIKRVEELTIKNTDKTRYRFDAKTNTLYIPISETDFHGMFSYCYGLKKIDLGVDNEIIYAYRMFENCIDLIEVNFTKKLNLKKVGSLQLMFFNCLALKKPCLTEILTSNKLYDIMHMFNNCFSLETANFGDNFYSENIKNINSIFNSCYNLETINWQKCQPFHNLVSMKYAFAGCSKLKTIDLSGVDFSKISANALHNAFYKTSIDLEVLVNNTFKKELVES